MAAAVGGVGLSLAQEGDRVVFTAVVEAEDATPSEAPVSSLRAQRPSAVSRPQSQVVGDR